MFCPNIKFTLSNKDPSEINACHISVPKAKHQLCYWHGIQYIEERLAKDKPPATYDPRTAHGVFEFIDPTWAPGVTRGDVGMSTWTVMIWRKVLTYREVYKNSCKTSTRLVSGYDHIEWTNGTLYFQNPVLTTLAPLVIIKAGNQQLPIWPAPPSICRARASVILSSSISQLSRICS